MAQYILAIDQGTTSSRAMIFNGSGEPVSCHQCEFKQHYPQNGWVEHDPNDIWQTVLQSCHAAIEQAKLTAQDIKAIGISNQRETTIVWDRRTGEPIYNAIVWQDRRTADYCRQPELLALEDTLKQKTGLCLDPYFSATKIAWILQHVEGARSRAERGELVFGTVDTYLLWKLTDGRSFFTDVTNAARTLLFNIHEQIWDEELLRLFAIPMSMLPKVLDNAAYFGDSDPDLFGAPIPITGMVGDQQAAAFGQACFDAGMVKSTYGTGCFVLANTGDRVVATDRTLLATIAYRLNGKTTYAIEGSIFNAGTIIKWLRDQMHMLGHAGDSANLASQLKDNGGVYFVPAFTGLGAPYWDPHARGAIFGLTRNTQQAHIVRAGLEAVAYQTRDLMLAMLAHDKVTDWQQLRVDGGMVANTWLMQFLADMLAIPIVVPAITETSVLGAAYMAGLGAGIYSGLGELAKLWKAATTYQPNMSDTQRSRLYSAWQQALKGVLTD